MSHRGGRKWPAMQIRLAVSLYDLLLIVYGREAQPEAPIPAWRWQSESASMCSACDGIRNCRREELAHRAKVHQTYLSGVEGGKRNPSIGVLSRIAHALGVDIEEFFKKRPSR